MRAKLGNLGTMGRFAVVASAVAVVAGAGLWILLARSLDADLRERETHAAELLATTAVAPALTGDAPGDGLDAVTTAALDDLVRVGGQNRRVRALVIRNLRGVAVYTSAPGSTERQGAAPPTATTVTATTSDALTVAVPLRADVAGPTAAVAEIQIASAPLLGGKLLLALWIAAALAGLVGAMLVTTRRTLSALGRKVEKHQHQALHDPLTSLPNRTLFNDRVAQCARERQRGGEAAAVMLIDLDRFKEVNDTLGHRCGDLLLAEVSRRLSGRLRRSDTVARLGGDEFGILLPIIDGVAGAATVVDNLRKALAAPFLIDGHSLRVGASFGIALMADCHDPETLLQRADQAMYRAKKERHGYAFYDAQIDGGERDQLALLSELRRAIGRGELRLVYQPKADLATGRIRGVEALVRWQHPKRGLIPPSLFIPLAEQNGLMRHLTYWVLDEAMRQARDWAEKGQGLKIAVNLSQESLLDETMPAEIVRVLERHRVPARALEIEITESALVSDLEAASDALSNLAEMGIALSIDDYGTGFSSLSHVRALPVGCIKIDRSFVSGMLADSKSATIVRSTIDLARDLGIGVVAEGVETRAEWDALGALGCLVAQGYLISRPVPGAELFEWLERVGNRFVLADAPEDGRGGGLVLAGASNLPDFA